MKFRHARRWVSDNLRIFPSKVARWSSKVNAKSVLVNAALSDLRGMSVQELAQATSLSSLEAHTAPWKLPFWPSKARLRSAVKSSWNEWSQAHRLPYKAIRKGTRTALEGFQAFVPQEVPAQWARYEFLMSSMVLQSKVRVFDDKLSTKIWSCSAVQLFATLVASLEQDELWSLHPRLTITDVQAAGHAKAVLGIPWFLRTRVGLRGQPGYPKLFAFVKSKCFADSGKKVCQKPNHSCFRRVMDTSQVAFASSWKVLGRAVRAVMQAIGGHEVYDQSEAGERVAALFSSLGPPASQCKVCGCDLDGKVCVLSADVDQAFESCQGSNVGPAWSWASSKFQSQWNSNVVQIKRGKRFEYRVGPVPWSRGWWLLNLEQCGKALMAAASVTLAVVGDVVAQLHGMSIGGSMSSSAVSVRFATEEAVAFKSPSHVSGGFGGLGKQDVNWLRYVDDVLAASRCVCSVCMERFFSTLYSEPLSVVFSSSRDCSKPCVWLHFEIYVVGSGVAWTLKNSNRSYLFGMHAAPFVPAFLPWPGALPYHFKQLRSIMISRLALAWSSQLSVIQSSLCVLELLLELHRLQYPLDLLRALIHSTPKVPAALLARQIFRAFLQSVGPLSSKAWKMGKGGDGRGSHGYSSNSQGRRRDTGHREPKRESRQDPKKDKKERRPRRRSSSSSSTSTAARKQRRSKAARELLLKEDSDFAAFLQAKELAEQEHSYRKQGELLAGVLREKFDEAIQAGSGNSKQSQSQVAVVATPPTVPGTSGGFSEAQMEQLKTMVVALIPPQQPQSLESESPREKSRGRASSGPPDATEGLRRVHVSLLSALFGNRFKISTDTTLPEFKEMVQEKWGQRPVVDAISSFLKEHTKDAKIPKSKGDRIDVFWQTLLNLD